MKNKIFISYTTADIEIANYLTSILEYEGNKVFICPRDIPPGKNYSEWIPNTIKSCDIFIVIISKKSFESNNVESEIRFAFNFKIKMIPVKLDNVDLPVNFDYFLGNSQWVMIDSENFEDSFNQILDIISDKSQTGFFHGIKSKKYRNIIFIAIVAIVLSIEAFIAIDIIFPDFYSKIASSIFPSNESKEQASLQSLSTNEEISTAQSNSSNSEYATYITTKSYEDDGIILYDSAGSNNITGSIPEGKMCSLIKQENYSGEEYGEVSFCGIKGWTSMNNLRFYSEENHGFSLRLARDNPVFVNKNEGISFFSEPSHDSKELFTDVPYGTELYVTTLENGWGKTTYHGKDAWVDMTQVNFYSSQYYMIERCDGRGNEINLRSNPSEEEDSEILDKIPNGTILQAKEYSKGWGKFYYKGMTGWVKLYYMTSCPEDGFKENP